MKKASRSSLPASAALRLARSRAIASCRCTDRPDARLRGRALQRERHLRVVGEEVPEPLPVPAQPVQRDELVGADLEAGHPADRVRRPARLAELAVVHDAQPGVRLPGDHAGDRRRQLTLVGGARVRVRVRPWLVDQGTGRIRLPVWVVRKPCSLRCTVCRSFHYRRGALARGPDTSLTSREPGFPQEPGRLFPRGPGPRYAADGDGRGPAGWLAAVRPGPGRRLAGPTAADGRAAVRWADPRRWRWAGGRWPAAPGGVTAVVAGEADGSRLGRYRSGRGGGRGGGRDGDRRGPRSGRRAWGPGAAGRAWRAGRGSPAATGAGDELARSAIPVPAPASRASAHSVPATAATRRRQRSRLPRSMIRARSSAPPGSFPARSASRRASVSRPVTAAPLRSAAARLAAVPRRRRRGRAAWRAPGNWWT